MISVIILSIFFLILLIFSFKRSRGLAGYLYFLYLMSFISTILLSFFFNENVIVKIIPSLYLFIVLNLWFLPFDRIKIVSISNTYFSKQKLLSLSLFSILLLFPSTIYFIFYSLKLLLNADLSTVRLSAGQISILPKSIFNTIASGSSSLYIIPMVLFFITIKERMSRILSFLLFFSTLSFPFLCLNFAGRDGILYWLINFMLLFFIFRNYIHFNVKKRIKRIMLICVLLGGGVFLIISIHRFGGSMNKELFRALISYLGQQIGNFSDAFYVNINYNETLFPGIKKLFNMYTDSDNTISLLIKQNAFSEYNVFGFYVKTLIWGYGWLGGLLISFVFYIVMIRLVNLFNKEKNLFQFLIVYILYQIPLNGVFYYRQGVGSMDLAYLLIITILYLMMKFKLKIDYKRILMPIKAKDYYNL